MLDTLPQAQDPRLLVGGGTFDDAGVWRLNDEVALVQSVDFFTPVVDDPFDFGQVAAANALSDIYAMGARPITALAVCAFPATGLSLHTLSRTFAGGMKVLAQDAVTPLGGHTVKGPEFTYGLAVTGLVHPHHILTNSHARPGDRLLLTKPLGTGVMATALKRRLLPPAPRRAMLASMVQTNRAAAQACQGLGVHALTDITGFGFLGHGMEMAKASGVALCIDADAIPLLDGALEAARLASDFAGMASNRRWVEHRANLQDLDPTTLHILCDPQTSGGLLVSVDPSDSHEYLRRCQATGVHATLVGQVMEGPPGTIRISGACGR